MASNSSSQIRQRLFDLYSNNLILVKDRYKLRIEMGEAGQGIEVTKKVYICPLCHGWFFQDALDQNQENPLTIEHVPPRSIGGKAMLLTCKTCNNGSGIKLDHLILDSVKAQAFLAGKRDIPINARIAINNNSKFSVSAKISGDKELEFLAQGKNPDYALSQINKLNQNWEGSSMKLSFLVPDLRSVATGLLRAGYLKAFSYFGYTVLLDSNLERIRDQINHPDKEILPHPGVFKVDPKIKARDGVHIILSPIKAYCIIFTIRFNQHTEQIGVLVPGPGNEGWENFLELKKIAPPSNLTFNELTLLNCINKKEFVDGFYQIWYHTFHQ